MILDIARDGVLTMLLVAGPLLLLGLAVGVLISLFQTLTSLQEMTLVFVPKILVIFGSMIMLLPYMIQHLTQFMYRMMDIVVALP
jgi:flagellar biosynthetic protein FliQ